MSFFDRFWHGFRPPFRCFSMTFDVRGVPLRPGGRPWARGGVRGHIFHDFLMILGGPFELILGPFSNFSVSFFVSLPRWLQELILMTFGSMFGAILESFSAIFGDRSI